MVVSIGQVGQMQKVQKYLVKYVVILAGILIMEKKRKLQILTKS
jgi:hypothetical protein